MSTPACSAVGFQAASREWIFYTDGDAQYDVTELERMKFVLKGGVVYRAD